MSPTPPAGATSADAASTARRTHRVSLLLAAAAVWGLVIAVAVGIGPTRLAEAIAPAPQDGFVELSLTDAPTLQWTGRSAGTVHLTYEVTRTGGRGGPVTLHPTAEVTGGDPVAQPDRTLILAPGQSATGTVEVPVRCRDRVKVSLQATGPEADAEVFTWAEPATDDKGGPVCRLI